MIRGVHHHRLLLRFAETLSSRDAVPQSLTAPVRCPSTPAPRKSLSVDLQEKSMLPTDYAQWTAIGTVGAAALALILALIQAGIAIVLSVRRRRAARQKVASLVSAWVERTYAPSPDGDYYRRTVHLHVSNESDEPVYRVEVVCGIGVDGGTIQLGPLSAPRVIPVLPPRREFVYDVTMGVLGFGDYGHDSFRSLVAEVSFRDHEGKRWERDFDGGLSLVEKPRAAVLFEAQSELIAAQAGPLDSAYNPRGLVFAIAHAASDDDMSDEDFRQLLHGQAPGWRQASDEEVAAVRDLLQTANVATHAWYPTPRIAYVRLIESLPGGGVSDRAHILTLVWRNGRGWTLFGSGPFLPWDVPFDPGELDVDPLDRRPRLEAADEPPGPS